MSEDDGFLVPPGFSEDLKRTIAELFAVPICTCEQCEARSMLPVKRPWHMRFRMRCYDKREQFATLVYQILSGHDLPESYC